MPSGYASREDANHMKKTKQSMADLKLRRLTELNTRLREDLERERIPVSQAAKSILNYTKYVIYPLKSIQVIIDLHSIFPVDPKFINPIISTKDYMVPSIWGSVDKKDDPYTPQQSGGCCVVM
ncbi:Guanine nucleotide-binding protein subunit gamma [Erysiphe necator]|nr:Guanine nucleotide-binding protein subunit gamma [Erysiphe necator]